MTAPTGYKLYSGYSSPEITAKAVALLSQDYGYQEITVIDGKELLFVVETHNVYGSQPDRPPSPHKGVTVYEKTDDSKPFLAGALLGVAGYLLWRRR